MTLSVSLGIPIKSVLSTHLLSDMEREMLWVLFCVPRDVIQIQILDITVLEVFFRSVYKSSLAMQASSYLSTRLDCKQALVLLRMF